MDNFLEFLGRLHPLLVHFPIALILTGGAIELLRPGKERPSEAGVTCLGFGALSAILAAGAGWLHAEHADVGASMEGVLFRHRWVGVGVSAVGLLTWLFAWRMRVAPSATLGSFVRGGILLSMLLVGYDGHLGGTLVYGEGYLLESLTKVWKSERVEPTVRESVPEDPLQGGEAGGDPGETPPEPAETAPEGAEPDAPADVVDEPEGAGDETAGAPVSYAREILPIFEARCYKCHGPTGKARGGLRIVDIAALSEGPEEEWLLRPGDAEGSRLYQLLVLPADDLDIMPASGDPLTADEIEVIRRWIDQGALVDEAPSTGAVVPPADEGAGGASEEESEPAGDEPARVALDDEQRAMRDEALATLRALGAHAAPLAQDTDEVEVHFGLLGSAIGDEALDALAGLEPCLVSLDLSRTAVTDAGLEAVARFVHLSKLRLDQTGVGDAGMEHLAGLQRLASLNLFATSVGDAGLEAVSSLPALEKLYVWQSAVTPEAVARVREARPDLTIVAGEERTTEEGDSD